MSAPSSAPKRALLSTLKWSLLADWASKVLPPLVFIVLARLLTPADFGVMSAAIAVTAFSRIFWEAGMGKALISHQGDPHEAANVAFWISGALGLAIACALFPLATPIAQVFFHDIRVIPVLRVLTLEVLFGALSAVPTALLQREMKFRELFWVRLVTVALPALASIPLALAGMGYWALVAGVLAGQIAQFAMLWSRNRWRPRWTFDRTVAGRLARFGSWVGLTALVAWIYTWADSFIAGHYFGTPIMGLYRVGNQSAIIPFECLFAFASPVLYSRFSAHSMDFDKVRSDVFKINSIVGAVSLPLALALIVFSPLVESMIFGAKWRGVGIIIAMIAAKEGVLWIFAYNIEAYRALAKPHLETAIAVLSAALNPLILILCAQRGFDTFLFGRAVLLGVVGALIHLSFSIGVFGYAAVRLTYTRLLMIFLVCGALFGVRELFRHAFEARPLGYLVDAVLVIAAFTFALGLQRNSIAELARA